MTRAIQGEIYSGDALAAHSGRRRPSEIVSEYDAKCTCETAGCHNTVDEEGDLCHGCEADLSHRNFWGSGIPMGHHDPS